MRKLDKSWQKIAIFLLILPILLVSLPGSVAASSKPHAVTQVGPISYVYDNNGNMTQRGPQTISWNSENKPLSVVDGSDRWDYRYDAFGDRVIQQSTEDGITETTIYVNPYLEIVNPGTGQNVIIHYYLGGQEVAYSSNNTLNYILTDHLGSTTVTTNSSGTQTGTSMAYYPYGKTLSGSVDTDNKFTGQRLDGSGLYYYNARYYDPEIGRFISADPTIPDPTNPQDFNRYTYCSNNPLTYTDPSGLDGLIGGRGKRFTPPYVDPVTDSAYYTVSQAAYGVKDSVVNTYNMASDPIGTAKGLGYAVTHPNQTWDAIYADYSGRMGSIRGMSSIGTDIAIGILGTKGAGMALKAASKSALVARIGETLANSRLGGLLAEEGGYLRLGGYGRDAIHMHHSFPRFLGGQQARTAMSKSLHVQLHCELITFLKSNYPGMVPSWKNPGYIIRYNYRIGVTSKVMAEFYSGPGAKYTGAAEDFFRQFPDLK